MVISSGKYSTGISTFGLLLLTISFLIGFSETSFSNCKENIDSKIPPTNKKESIYFYKPYSSLLI